LVRAAFGDSFRTHDWLHGVEGVHVLITEEDEVGCVRLAEILARAL